MILKGDEVLLHYVDLNRASVYRHPIGNSLLGRFTGIASNEESLERAYNLQVASVQTGESEGEALIQLCMQPKSSQQSRYLRQIEVLIDPVSWLPQKIIISEANDDTNIIILSDLIENGLIRDGLFDVTPPNGVHLMQFPGGKTQ
jgi:outer membrane lipoprotein-sorting protein